MDILRGVIVLFCGLLLTSFNYCFADELRLDKDTEHQQRIMQIGFRILNANNIDKRITFRYNSEKKVRVTISSQEKSVTVYKGLLPYIDNDNELAAVLSVCVGSLTDYHKGIFKRLSINYSPRKYEKKAEKKAVDLMVNAGYDPIALINIINKTAPQPCWFEYNIFHHSGSERVAYIYRYIYEKYPIYLADNNYLKTPYYQNFLYTSKNTRKTTRLLQQEQFKMKEKKNQE